jgi:hypothetical protein
MGDGWTSMSGMVDADKLSNELEEEDETEEAGAQERSVTRKDNLQSRPPPAALMGAAGRLAT